jgi:L-glutamine-phosphate cytidylyltransferase
MRALIMAAGRGTRISRYIGGKPKCTVNIGDIKLIENTILELRKANITEIGIVLGYNGEIIMDVLKDYNIQFFTNPFFDVTNSIASAWFARDFIDGNDDLLVLNGDVFFESSLLADILSVPMSPVLFCDDSRKEDADYKFYYENNKLIKYGKELAGEDISGEYIGIAKINRDFIKIFKGHLLNMISQQKHSLWWENVLYTLTDHYDIYVEDIKGKFWAEVDYVEDYERILRFRNYQLSYQLSVEKVKAPHLV